MFGQCERRSRSFVYVCSSRVLVHIDILSICRRRFLTVCLEPFRRRSLLAEAVVARSFRRANSGTLLVLSVCSRGGAPPGLLRPRCGAVSAVVRVVRVCSIANVLVVASYRRSALRVIAAEQLGDEGGEVGGGGAAFGALAPLSQPGDAAVLAGRGLQGCLGHQEAQGLMGNGVKQEVAFAHQRPGGGEVQLGFPAWRGVREEALHAEGVAFLQRGAPGPPGTGTVRALRRDLLRFCWSSLVWVALQLAEVVPRLVTAGFRLVSRRTLGAGKFHVNSPVVGGGLLLAVGELGDPAVALGAPGRVEALARQQFALRLQQFPLLLPLLLLGALLLPPRDLFGIHGLAAARGGVGVVGGSPRALLRVLLFPPFCSSVLEPNLPTNTQTART